MVCVCVECVFEILVDEVFDYLKVVGELWFVYCDVSFDEFGYYVDLFLIKDVVVGCIWCFFVMVDKCV